MTMHPDNKSWSDALSAVSAAYAAANTIGANHGPGTVRESQFHEAAAAIGDAIERLMAVPAPDFASVSTKLNLLDQEFGGADAQQLRAIEEDLRRLAGISPVSFEAETWLADFEAVGGGFVIAETGVQICVMLHGYPPSANREAKRLFDLINGDPIKQQAVKGVILARNRAALVEGEGA